MHWSLLSLQAWLLDSEACKLIALAFQRRRWPSNKVVVSQYYDHSFCHLFLFNFFPSFDSKQRPTFGKLLVGLVPYARSRGRSPWRGLLNDISVLLCRLMLPTAHKHKMYTWRATSWIWSLGLRAWVGPTWWHSSYKEKKKIKFNLNDPIPNLNTWPVDIM